MLSKQSSVMNLEQSPVRPKPPKHPPVMPPLTKSPDAVSIALKRMHQNVISEDVPQDFMDLLSAIERKIDDGGQAQ
jgi:hypothetical protein